MTMAQNYVALLWLKNLKVGILHHPFNNPKIQLPLKVPDIEFNFDVSFLTLMYP